MLLDAYSSVMFRFFLALFMLASCASVRPTAPPAETWYLATEQAFFGGVKGSPAGTIYTIEMCAPVSYRDFKPGDLNVNGLCYRSGVRIKGVGKPLETFEKSDTILVSVSIFRDAMQKTPTVPCKYSLKKDHAAYLTWTEKGKEKVLHIPNLKKLEPLVQP